MNKIIYLSLFTFAFTFNLFAYCDETGSYNKTWTTQAIEKENGREAREKYYKTLTLEEKMSISDFEIYPNLMMTCSMGFSNGLAKIIVDGKAGFINTKGEIVIKPKYNNSGRFSENIAPVQFKNGKWGYINKKGEIVIKPKFDWALIFREGIALVQVNDEWGYINSTGKFVVEPQFYHANSFSEDVAHVQIMKEKLYSGYIDKKGNWIIPLIYHGGNDFQNGIAIVSEDVKDEKGFYKYTECYSIKKDGTKIEETECSRSSNTKSILDSVKIELFFDDYRTGYKSKLGKTIWKPTK